MIRTQFTVFKLPRWGQWTRTFSVSSRRDEIRDIESLPRRLLPKYEGVHQCLCNNMTGYRVADKVL